MRQESFLLEGIIIPNEWDDKGQIKRISLSTNSEQVLPIVMDDMGRELVKYLQLLVRAKVDLLEGTGDREIKVLSYKKIAEYSL